MFTYTKLEVFRRLVSLKSSNASDSSNSVCKALFVMQMHTCPRKHWFRDLCTVSRLTLLDSLQMLAVISNFSYLYLGSRRLWNQCRLHTRMNGQSIWQLHNCLVCFSCFQFITSNTETENVHAASSM